MAYSMTFKESEVDKHYKTLEKIKERYMLNESELKTINACLDVFMHIGAQDMTPIHHDFGD